MLRWYDQYRRDLPWRANRDPYRVWVSEIMLQQTRVAAVLEYFRRFMQEFPEVHQLAEASEERVLTLWSGLGYYRRARMMHAAAKEVMNVHGGEFPRTLVGLRTLPGIGRYTAAAIASIAFGERTAVVDGNVERVLNRLHGLLLDGESVWERAEELLDPQRPGDWNQAMMELGATVCTPKQPSCMTCPVHVFCATRGELAQVRKPVRIKRSLHYVLDHTPLGVVLVQRPASVSLMPGMWELPQAPDAAGEILWRLRHSITTTDYVVLVSRGSAPEGLQVSRTQVHGLGELPLTGLARKILKRANII